MAKKKKSRTTVMKIELNYYLEEDNLSIIQEFDILWWWKTNGLKFPTLQVIARDVSTIQITTSHSSPLHIIIEALMCTRS